MYKQILNIDSQVHTQVICRVADNAFIPFDPANTDYIAYLAWLEAGNTPEAAE